MDATVCLVFAKQHIKHSKGIKKKFHLHKMKLLEQNPKHNVQWIHCLANTITLVWHGGDNIMLWSAAERERQTDRSWEKDRLKPNKGMFCSTLQATRGAPKHAAKTILDSTKARTNQTEHQWRDLKMAVDNLTELERMNGIGMKIL